MAFALGSQTDSLFSCSVDALLDVDFADKNPKKPEKKEPPSDKEILMDLGTATGASILMIYLTAPLMKCFGNLCCKRSKDNGDAAVDPRTGDSSANASPDPASNQVQNPELT